MNFKLAIMPIIVFLFISCLPKKVSNTISTTENQSRFSPEILEAKSVYENNCANCHKLYSPKEYTAQEWRQILVTMQKKAKITDDEVKNIYSYLILN